MNPDFENALDKIINTNQNLHIIGPAGVGKSTLIKIISDNRVLKGNTVVVAPTGIAAVNASSHGLVATTIHRLLSLPPYTIYPDNLLGIKENLESVINAIDNLIIDEASMCNASLFDFIVESFRLYRAKQEKDLPRIFLVADPFQLPPVISSTDSEVKKYFEIMYNGRYMYFSSNSYQDLGFKTIQLNTIYRQKDSSIQNIFNRLRQGVNTSEDLAILNERVIPEIEFAKKNKFYVYIAMNNEKVNEVNDSFLEVLDGKLYTFNAEIKGNFDKNVSKHLQETVKLKLGLQVMITKNAPEGPQIYSNGTLGVVRECYHLGSKDEQKVLLEANGGNMITVPRGDFDQYTFVKTENGTLMPEKTATFNQILVKGAQALTVHKTQGLTLEALYFDMGSWIGTAGLAYVALSRAKTLEGICLSRKITKKDIKVNQEVLDFLSKV